MLIRSPISGPLASVKDAAVSTGVLCLSRALLSILLRAFPERELLDPGVLNLLRTTILSSIADTAPFYIPSSNPPEFFGSIRF